MNINEIDQKAMQAIRPYFDVIDQTAYANAKKVLDAFAAERVGAPHLTGSTGYGYSDTGRDTLDRVLARTLDARLRPGAMR